MPQGGILSPLLYNVMVKDVPQTEGVYNLEYADDITIICSSESLDEVTNKIECQLEKIYKWSQDWGFKINLDKTKAMFFTRRKINHPIIKMNNSELPFVRTNKYLGMILDSPKLTWKNHIEYLSLSSITKVNIMRAITRFHWGADRNILLRFYKSVIRGKMDYGAIFYGVSSHSNLKKLDVIQNKCLRIAIGAKRTSPVMSLEVEGNVMPLNRHRIFLTIKYYLKIAEFPPWHPFKTETSETLIDLINYNWNNSNNIPPFHVAAQKLLDSLNMDFILNENSCYLSPLIPWVNYTDLINLEFFQSNVSKISNNVANSIFQQILNSKYNDFIEIYTDGSFTVEPRESAACSVVILDNLIRTKISYKLNENVRIMGCELYAILKALELITNLQNYSAKNYVIFSDSLSGLQSIMSPNPQNCKEIILQIQELLLLLNNSCVVKLQFIPGHKGIVGNEEADIVAKMGHSKETTEIYLGREEKVRMLLNIMTQRWENQWKQLSESLQKGLHIRLIKNEIKFWPWASHRTRITETLFARLRIGHVNVGHYLFKIGKSTTDKCSCGAIETVEHLLIQCRIYEAKRHEMTSKLGNFGIDLTLKNLLGGGNFDIAKQHYIINIVTSYLSSIKRLRNL